MTANKPSQSKTLIQIAFLLTHATERKLAMTPAMISTCRTCLAAAVAVALAAVACPWIQRFSRNSSAKLEVVVSEELAVLEAAASNSSLVAAAARGASPADSAVRRAVSTLADMGPRTITTATTRAHQQPSHETDQRQDEDTAEAREMMRKGMAATQRTKRHGRLRLRRHGTEGSSNSVESAWSSLLRSSSFLQKP